MNCRDGKLIFVLENVQCTCQVLKFLENFPYEVQSSRVFQVLFGPIFIELIYIINTCLIITFLPVYLQVQ